MERIEQRKVSRCILQKGVRVRYAEEPFKLGGQDFDRGSLIVTRTANKNLPKSLDT